MLVSACPGYARMLSVAVGFGVKSGVKSGVKNEPLSVVGWGGAQTWSAHARNTWLAGKGSTVRIRHAPPYLNLEIALTDCDCQVFGCWTTILQVWTTIVSPCLQTPCSIVLADCARAAPRHEES